MCEQFLPGVKRCDDIVDFLKAVKRCVFHRVEPHRLSSLTGLSKPSAAHVGVGAQKNMHQE